VTTVFFIERKCPALFMRVPRLATGMSSHARDAVVDGEQSGGVSVDRLYREIAGEASDDAETEPGRQSEEVLDSVLDSLFPDEEFVFDEETVKSDLDELLITLVALRESETHGKGLMEDLSQLFDARLSPGTVYPRLHDLEEDEILEMQELVRTKEYRIGDLDASRERVEDSMRQHLALGFFLYSALNEL